MIRVGHRQQRGRAFLDNLQVIASIAMAGLLIGLVLLSIIQSAPFLLRSNSMKRFTAALLALGLTVTVTTLPWRADVAVAATPNPHACPNDPSWEYDGFDECANYEETSWSDPYSSPATSSASSSESSGSSTSISSTSTPSSPSSTGTDSGSVSSSSESTPSSTSEASPPATTSPSSTFPSDPETQPPPSDSTTIPAPPSNGVCETYLGTETGAVQTYVQGDCLTIELTTATSAEDTPATVPVTTSGGSTPSTAPATTSTVPTRTSLTSDLAYTGTNSTALALMVWAAISLIIAGLALRLAGRSRGSHR